MLVEDLERQEGQVGSIYDLLPDLGSYLSDMEQCLRMDAETWAKYQENPVPFIVDLLLDFGEWPEGIENHEAVAIEVARKWAGR